MRVAFLTYCFPVISETFVARLAIGLLQRGHEVDIVANYPGDFEVDQLPKWTQPRPPIHRDVLEHDLLERTTYLNLPIEVGFHEHRVWAWGRRPTRIARALPVLARALRRSPRLAVQTLDRRRYGSQALSLSALYRLSGLTRLRGGYDVLHAHFGWAGRDYRMAPRLLKAPLIVTFYGGGDIPADAEVARRRGDDRVFAEADAIVANCDYTRKRLVALGCPEAKIRLVPVGLDLEAIRMQRPRPGPDGEVRLFTIARLTEMKGLQYAIEAVALLAESHPGLRYEVVGEGEEREKLEALIAERGLKDRVTLHGDTDQTLELLQSAHVFVLPSVTDRRGRHEGQGLALQEAQAAGLPVVATRHAGLPEGMVPGESGYLVPERDVRALAAAIDRLLRHPERWESMGRVGRRFVASRYDVRELARRHEELYAEVAAAHARAV